LTGTKSNIGKGKTQKFAVEKYGVEDEVLELYKKNMPATKISKYLEANGVKIAPTGINRWLAMQRKVDMRDLRIENVKKFETMVVNYKNEITNILDEVKVMKDLAKEEQKLDSYVKLVGKLFQGLELLAKLMGDMKPTDKVDVKVMINAINKDIFEKKKELRKTLYADGVSVVTIEEDLNNDEKN